VGLKLWAFLLVLLFLVACAGGEEERVLDVSNLPTFTLRSPAFAQGQPIPQRYTCDGEDVSPPLAWEGAPQAAAFVLIVDDPDAPMGTFTHWVLYNIPGQLTSLPEGLAKEGRLSQGMLQGRNDFGRLGYGGPCPPRGPAHRYYFRLYALHAPLDLPPGANKAQVLKAMEGHVLAWAELMGTYGRGP
jgi:hypothetical protein